MAFAMKEVMKPENLLFQCGVHSVYSVIKGNQCHYNLTAEMFFNNVGVKKIFAKFYAVLSRK